MTIWLYTWAPPFISLLALIGILALYVRGERLNDVLLSLSASRPARCWATSFELMPELIEARGTSMSPVLIVAGIVVFFAIEQAIRRWQAEKGSRRRTTTPRTSRGRSGRGRPAARAFLRGEPGRPGSQLIDGLAIGSTFLLDIRWDWPPPWPWLHEVPQELATAVLVHAGAHARAFQLPHGAHRRGRGRRRAARAGERHVAVFLVPFTAGTFIYLAVGDHPELHCTGIRGRRALHRRLAGGGVDVSAAQSPPRTEQPILGAGEPQPGAKILSAASLQALAEEQEQPFRAPGSWQWQYAHAQHRFRWPSRSLIIRIPAGRLRFPGPH